MQSTPSESNRESAECLSNVSVVDPDMVYAYVTPIIEVDRLCRSAHGLVAYEDVSSDQERLVKPASRGLLSLAMPPTIMVRASQANAPKVPAASHEWKLALVTSSEIVNMIAYLALLAGDLGDGNASIYKRIRVGLTKVLGPERGISEDAFEALARLYATFDAGELGEIVSERLKKLRAMCSMLSEPPTRLVILLPLGAGPMRVGQIGKSLKALLHLCRTLGIHLEENFMERTACYVSRAVWGKTLRSLIREGVRPPCGVLMCEADCDGAQLSRGGLELRGSTRLPLGERAVYVVFSDYAKRVLADLAEHALEGDSAVLIVEEVVFGLGPKGFEDAQPVASYYGYLNAIKRAAQSLARAIANSSQPTPREFLSNLARSAGLPGALDEDELFALLAALKVEVLM